MQNIKRNIVLIFMGIFIILTTIVGLSFAYYLSGIAGTETIGTVETALFGNIVFTGGNNFTDNTAIEPGWEKYSDVTITVYASSGPQSVDVNIDYTNTFTDLEYKIELISVQVGEAAAASTSQYVESDLTDTYTKIDEATESTTLKLGTATFLSCPETIVATYRVSMRLPVSAGNSNMNKTFNAQIYGYGERSNTDYHEVTEVTTTEIYIVSPGNLRVGSTIDRTDYENGYSIEDVRETYMLYHIDTDDTISGIDVCKKGSANAPAICIPAIDTSKYNENKEAILEYFGGSSSNMPADCSEEQGWDGSMELTCQNEYVTLATNSGGGVFINNSEEYNSCVIEPAMGIYSCQQSPKPTYNTIYTTSTGGLRTGSTIDPSNYENGYDEEDVPSTYLRYHATNNVVDEVDVCKKPTANAGEICVTVEQPSRYSEIKETILEYFGGSSQNMPAECSEETGWSGDLELTCANSYVVIGFDSGGGTWVKDVENQTECLIQPAFGIYSCS